jgi:hypothetical protein
VIGKQKHTVQTYPKHSRSCSETKPDPRSAPPTPHPPREPRALLLVSGSRLRAPFRDLIRRRTAYQRMHRSTAVNRPPQSQRSSPGSKGIARSVRPRARTTGSSRRLPSTRGAATSRRMQSGVCSSKRSQINPMYAAHLRQRRPRLSNFSTLPTATASRYWSLVAISAVWFSATSRRLSITPAHGGVFGGISK